MEIGSELRRARTARGLSLDDVARETKISHSVLRALENNAFRDVPGGLFTRGYLRAYAGAVGLDGQAIVDAYRAEFDPPAPAVFESNGVAREDGHDEAPWNIEEREASSRHSEILQFTVLIVVALVYLGSLRHAKPAADLQTADAAVAAQAVVPPPPALDVRPVGTSGSASAVKAPMAIEIHPSGPCWVDITADGAHTFGRLMNAGDRATVSVGDDLILRVGDPAAFAFSIDGVAGRSLGPEGRAVTVRINRTNYRTLLDGRQGT